MNWPLLACGIAVAMLGGCLAADWRRGATCLREYTYRVGSRGPAFLRGTYDAPVRAYRLVGAFLAILGLILVVVAVARRG